VCEDCDAISVCDIVFFVFDGIIGFFYFYSCFFSVWHFDPPPLFVECFE